MNRQQKNALKHFVVLLGHHGASKEIGERVIKDIQEAAPLGNSVTYGHGRVNENPFEVTVPPTSYDRLLANHELADAATAYYNTLKAPDPSGLLFFFGFIAVVLALIVVPMLPLKLIVAAGIVAIIIAIANK